MKRAVLSLLLLSVLMLGVAPKEAQAQGSFKALKGGVWSFMVDTPFGRLPATFEFKNKGKGTGFFGAGFNFIYRESGNSFSLAFEIPGSLSPNGMPATVVIRGTKISDKVLNGTALLISEVADPTAAIKVGAATGAVMGSRP